MDRASVAGRAESHVSSSLKDKSVAVVTYTHKENGKPTYMAGPSQDLKQYLIKRAASLFFVEQPIPHSEDPTATAELYENGKKIKEYRFPMFKLPKKMRRPDIDSNLFAYILFKLRDVLSTLYFFLRVGRRFDIFIGVEAINAMLGLFFRALSQVGFVVYDIIDYSPIRFPNQHLNKIYHAMDNVCVRKGDAAWVQTQLIIDHRKTKGLSDQNQWVKPTGVDLEKARALPFEQVKGAQIIYVGGFYDRDGSELLIESLPQICSKINDLKLLLIGHGDRLNEIKKQVEALSLQKHVSFLGTISDADKVDALIQESAIGLAPYKDDPNSLKAYNDTAKPKLYLSLGTPVVMTNTTLFSKEIEKEKAGFAVRFDAKEWADAVIWLLEDPKRLQTYRQNALALAKKYSWDQIFDRLFNPILKKI